MIEGGGVTTRIKTTAPTLPPPPPPTPQLLIFHRLTQDNTFPSFPHIPSLPLPNPPQLHMPVGKCDPRFIFNAAYVGPPCNQATSSSSGQHAQSLQQPINVSTAKGEVRTLRSRVENQEAEVDNLEARLDNLEEQIALWTSRLVSKVKEIKGSPDEVKLAKAGVYNGTHVTAEFFAKKITKLEEEKKV